MQHQKVHRRQFIIDCHPHQIAEDWGVLEIDPGVYLSFERDLTLRREGTLLWLGAAFGSGVCANRFGRFASVKGRALSTDPNALLSVYYQILEGRVVVSSSQSLLSEIGRNEPIDRPLRWGGMNWFPGPGSRFVGIRRLLPNESLDLGSGSVTYLGDQIVAKMETGSGADNLAARLADNVQEIAKHHPIYLALTAGLDSRTLAAALVSSGVKFETVTQSINSPMDVLVAARISMALGVRHHIVEPLPADQLLSDKWDQHTGFATCDASKKLLVPRQQFRFWNPDVALLRGGCFEIGRDFFKDKLSHLDFSTATGAQLWAAFEPSPHGEMIAALDEWLLLRRQRHSGLDLMTAFYQDQRLGGWLALDEQGLDMFPGVSVQPANDNVVMGALLSASAKDRRSGAVQLGAIRRLAPELLKVPINPRDRAATIRSIKRVKQRLLRRLFG